MSNKCLNIYNYFLKSLSEDDEICLVIIALMLYNNYIYNMGDYLNI